MNPRVKAAYSRLNYLLSQIPLSEKTYRIDQSIVDSYHQAVDELSNETGENLDHFKVSSSNAEGGYGSNEDKVMWLTDAVRTQVGSLIGHLEGMYSLGEKSTSTSGTQPSITLINQNTIAITLNLSLSQLIEKAQSEEEREKLTELNTELNLPNKNWENIKGILVWAANFSKDLFFQLLPIILKHYSLSQ
jgi:hypothetical protein